MAEDVVEITYLVSEEARRAPEEFVAEDVPENHVVSEDVGMLTGVTESLFVERLSVDEAWSIFYIEMIATCTEGLFILA